jgi:hypothetical protein
MPPTLSVGLSKKIRLSNFSLMGANCGVQFEFPDGPEHDYLLRRARVAFAACERAVSEGLDRHRQPTGLQDLADAPGGGMTGHEECEAPPSRPESPAQLHALGVLRGRRGIDLRRPVADRSGTRSRSISRTPRPAA